MSEPTKRDQPHDHRTPAGLLVRVTFTFVPDDPDPQDPTGCSSDEFDRLMDNLMPIGAEDVQVERVE